MVKLIAARRHRLYGPQGVQDWFEICNSVVYLIGSILLCIGVILLLINFNHPHRYDEAHAGLILIAVALCVIIVVNLHDAGAHLSGIDFRLNLLSHDLQLALVEIGAPLVFVTGAVLYLIAVISMLKMKSLMVEGREHTAIQLLIAGSALWLLGSLHNACQVYINSNALIQLYQKAVYLPLLIASTLLLVSSVLWFKSWPQFVLTRSTQYGAIMIGFIAAILLVMAASVNILRVLYLRKLLKNYTQRIPLDTLPRSVQEQLEGESVSKLQPLLEQNPLTTGPPPQAPRNTTEAVSPEEEPPADITEEEPISIID
ncbi:hypothetical protein KP509_33G007500 [Ceratopteris richardii]|uniref:Uncharacterized protein n=1 Tax=Ceratopteris richardii TaxID=49495 RepID=A0A8T2QLH3_CERRI|nr:hypothetical protein KP509_33G007500 [Ceratopteris richardii]